MSEISEKFRKAMNLLISDDVEATVALSNGETVDWNMALEIVENEAEAIEARVRSTLSRIKSRKLCA